MESRSERKPPLGELVMCLLCYLVVFGTLLVAGS